MNKIYLICTAILGVSKIEMNEDVLGRLTAWKKARKLNPHITFK